MGRNTRTATDEDWEREAMLDRAFEHEPRVRRRRVAGIGARVRTAMIGARATNEGGES
jgi:hypothetical protein